MKTTDTMPYKKAFRMKQVTNEEPTKEQILKGIMEAIDEVKQIKAGKKKAVLLKDFLNVNEL